MPEITLEQFKAQCTTHQAAVEASVKELISQGAKPGNEKLATLESDVKKLGETISRLDEAIKQQKAAFIPGAEKESKKFSIGAFVQALYKSANKDAEGHNDPWADAGMEKELVDARTKANQAGTGSSGGYLIPPEAQAEIIDLAMADMPLTSMGITVLRGLRGDLPIPTLTSRPTSYWVGENVAPTTSDAAFGERKLSPKECAAYTKQSEKLIYQSRGVSDIVIRKALAESLALKIHEGMLRGTGTDKQPLGIMKTTGFTATSCALNTTSGRFRIDHASQMITDLEVADELKYGNANNFGFIMHPRVKAGMKRERVTQYSGQAATAGAPVLPMNLLMTDALLEQQLGYKFRSTTQVPATETGQTSTCSTVTFGKWDNFWLGLYGDLVIKVSDQAGDGSTGSAFLQRQLYILACQMLDTCCVKPTSFTKTGGAETAEASW